jgi:hypothetical protein
MEIIKLNLIPNGVNPTCHCSQYDEGRVIRIELFDGLTPYTLQSGDTVTLNVRKPDNTIVTTTVETTQGNNYVDIVTTEQICACVGYNLCDLTITNGSVVIGTLNFIMAIERDVLADGIPSQSVIEDLDELVQEAVGDNYYTKTETDNLLGAKADKSTTYTKTQVDSALALKADSSDVYTKAQADALLNDKADKSNTYTKTETDSLLALKADKSELYNVYPTEQESGAIAHFTDGADNTPVKSLECAIGSDGFSQADITVCGKNLFSYDLPIRNGYWSNDAFVGDNAIIPKESAVTWQYIRVYVEGLSSITLSGFDNQGGTNCAWLSSENVNDVISRFNSLSKNGIKTVPSGAKYLCLTIYNIKDKPTTYPNAQLEVGNQATTFEAYNGNTYTISFGSTFNDGVLKYENGEWFIDVSGTITPISSNTTVKTINGENNIFSDTGDVDVTIRADIGLYIDKRLNTTRSTPTLSLSKGNSNLSETQVKYEDPVEEVKDPVEESKDNNEER